MGGGPRRPSTPGKTVGSKQRLVEQVDSGRSTKGARAAKGLRDTVFWRAGRGA